LDRNTNNTYKERKLSMKPSKTDILICNKRELNSKVSYWENQKRKAEKQLQKLQAEIKELEKEIAKEN